MVNFQNNDDINFGDGENTPSQSHSSRPQRPARFQRPAATGGQPSERPQRPARPQPQRPQPESPVRPSRPKPQRPQPEQSSRPVRPQPPQQPVYHDDVYEEEAYTEPGYEEEPVDEYIDPIDSETLRLQRKQTELLEQLAARKAQAKENDLFAAEPEPRKRPKPQRRQRDEDDDDDESENLRGGRGGRKTPKGKPRGKKPSRKVNKNGDYAGARGKRLLPLIGFWGVIIILSGAGLKASFFPSSGPSKAQVAQVAQEAVGVKGFPAQSGERFAIDFAKIFFTYDNTSTGSSSALQERKNKLALYITDNLLQDIDPATTALTDTTATSSSDASNGAVTPDAPTKENTPTTSSDKVLVNQEVTYGPYVVKTTELSATLATYTLKIGTNSGSLFYVDVPVKYDPSQYSFTVAGPLSFTMNEQNVGSTVEDEYTAKYDETDESKQMVKDFRPDLQEFLKAWAASNTTLIGRYTSDSATDNAKRGLGGAVEFSAIKTLSVGFTDSTTTTKATGEVYVQWKDPKSGLYYVQSYRMKLLKNTSTNKWQVYDIVNFSEQFSDSASEKK